MKLRFKPWVKIPSWWLTDGKTLVGFLGGSDSTGSRGEKIAALQIYISIAILCVEELDENSQRVLTCTPSYDLLQSLTSLSRPMISSGIELLKKLNLIGTEFVGRKVRYTLTGYEYGKGWCKLPARALVTKVYDQYKIMAFRNMTKRSIIEFYALKLFLYCLAVRDNDTLFANPGYITIADKTAIPKSSIKKTTLWLVGAELFSDVKRANKRDSEISNVNQYYVVGCTDLLNRS